MTILDITAFGASPESWDSTAAIQAACDAAQPGDTVRVPPQTFLVDALRSVRPQSDTIFEILGTLKAIPNDDAVSAVVRVDGVSNLTINGPGSIIGERGTNDADNPAISNGMGLAILHSNRIVVAHISASFCKGDGFYLQDSNDVTIASVMAHNNKRNGLSIISGSRIKVTGSTFMAQNGPAPLPQAGIDIEPDFSYEVLTDLSITGNVFTANKGCGIYIAVDPSAIHSRITITGNTFDQHYRDGSGPPTSGKNTWVNNLGYALLRWVPGYDYWFWPRDWTA